jgi:hypothetical protein
MFSIARKIESQPYITYVEGIESVSLSKKEILK